MSDGIRDAFTNCRSINHTVSGKLSLSKNLLKFKKSKPDAKTPVRATQGSSGWDLYAAEIHHDGSASITTIHTGIMVEIPSGYSGILLPRSSIHKTGYRMANSIGLIDSDYRGELIFKFDLVDPSKYLYDIGDRIGQLVLIQTPVFNMVEVDSLTNTDRGDGGFGSSGDK